MSAPELFMYTNSVDTVIAHDAEDASRVYEEWSGSNEFPADEWSKRALGLDDTLGVYVEGHDGPFVKKTVREWIKEEGRGFFCSTEY